MSDIQILIPSLNPDTKLLGVVNSLLEETDYDIVLLDDGSEEQNKMFFKQFLDDPRCTLLAHAINLGKGRALKDGFNYILTHFPNTKGVVTVDGDGQHLTKDIIACVKALQQNANSLVLGSRDFDNKNVPAKSSIGNKVTRKTMKMLCGIDIPDTQTGLRGISKEFMKTLLSVQGERFEFETNMLISAKENLVPFKIVTIETVYLDDNVTTHFHPLKDSLKIYAIFVKFLLASISGFLIDILIFSILVSMLRDLAPLYYIFFSTAAARLVSAIYNYNVNKRTVFKNFEKNHTIALRYILLSIVQMCASSFLVGRLFALLHIEESIVKIVVDMILFFISFTIQREWVFKQKSPTLPRK